MKHLCAVLALLILASIPCSSAYWGIIADNTDSNSSVPRSFGCVMLNIGGEGRSWPNWSAEEQAWQKAGASTFWDLPNTIAESARILNTQPGNLAVDDRITLENGSREYPEGSVPLGNIFDPNFALQIQRASNAMSSRLHTPLGYRIAPDAAMKAYSYDDSARASWRQFLQQFFIDKTPSDDTNGDSVTFNSAFSTEYKTWSEVPLFTTRDLQAPNKRKMADLWLTDGYAKYVNGVCGSVRRQVNPRAIIGPGVNSVLSSNIDVSLLASGGEVNTLFVDSCAALPAIDCAAATFGAGVIAAGVPADSAQNAIRILPYVNGAMFKRTEASPELDAIMKLAPYADKLKPNRADVLWIIGDGNDASGIFDSYCVTEQTFALRPRSVDLSKYKAVIYRSSKPCISLAIMQELFEYALKGGVVFVDAYTVAGGPTICGRDNAHFWWQGMKLARADRGSGNSTLSYSDLTDKLTSINPYLVRTDDTLREEGKVTDSTGASYPLLIVRTIGGKGKWIFINSPGLWNSSFPMFQAVVKSESGVDLPDPSRARIYACDDCVLAIGGSRPEQVTVKCSREQVEVVDMLSDTKAAVKSDNGSITLPWQIAPGEAKLWVIH